MSVRSYSDYQSSQRTENQSGTPRVWKVGYFTALGDDGDEALVRFNYNTVDDIKVVSVHTVQVENRFRSVLCLRDSAKDALDLCPLCAKGEKVKNKTFFEMLVYSKGEDGKVSYVAETWERPAMFTREIVDAIADGVENGFCAADTPIRNILFKVKRLGKKRDVNTTYKVKVANPAVYVPTMFPADFSSYDDYDAARHSYMSKTKEEIDTFLSTGSFPVKEAPKAKEAAVKDDPIDSVFPSTSTPAATPVSTPAASVPVTPASSAVVSEPANTPEVTPTTNRPRRTYTF